MRLRELQLKNFRCFKELTIKFPTDYTVLIGINGSAISHICIRADRRQQKNSYLGTYFNRCQ